MKLYRIAKTRYIRDLSGEGARLYGGRWNLRGTPMMYTSESRALAAIEFTVHLSLSQAPGDLSLATLEIPGNISPEEIDLKALPDHWQKYPPPQLLAEVGTEWTRSLSSLLMRVPSAVVPHEFNILINPLHKDLKKVRLIVVENFPLDNRLIGSG
jgi:RES domain-containing protein